MKMTGESRSTKVKICPIGTWPTANRTWTGILGRMSVLRFRR